MAPLPFALESRILIADTDASGRIHYTCLFRHFEAAEIEYMRALGIHYRNTSFGLPRVHVECDYRLALQFDDLIRVEISLAKLGKSSARFEFRVLKENQVAATGAVVIACMDRATQRARAFPEDLRAKLAPALNR